LRLAASLTPDVLALAARRPPADDTWKISLLMHNRRRANDNDS
jgi:hypothetical protein